MNAKRLIRTIVRNKEEIYKEQFRKRGVKYIDHYSTVSLNHPTSEDYGNIATVSHVWSVGDRYSKLAYIFYEDPRFWWVIAWFNQLPTDAHISVGDVIYIPTPLEDALEIIRG